MTERIVNPREELRPEGWTQGDDAFSTPTPEWLAENRTQRKLSAAVNPYADEYHKLPPGSSTQ